MKEIKLPFFKGRGLSRRRALKQVLLAGTGLAVASGSVRAETSAAPGGSVMPTTSESVLPVISQSAPTAGTDYLMFLGQDFRPAFSTCNTVILGAIGIYTTNQITSFSVSVNLPQQALITEVEFYIWHKAAGTQGYAVLSCGMTSPSTNTGTNNANLHYTTVSPNLVTVPLTLTSEPRVDNTQSKFVLIWEPDSTSSNDILFGARVGYKGGTAHFGIYNS